MDACGVVEPAGEFRLPLETISKAKLVLTDELDCRGYGRCQEELTEDDEWKPI